MKSFIIILFLGAQVSSWQHACHYIITTIAQKEIQAKQPTLIPKLEEVLKILTPLAKENSHIFVESSSFADDVKFLGWNVFNRWHHNDNFVAARGNANFARNLYKHREGLNYGINQAKIALSNTKSSLVDDRLGKSFELRFLLHLFGDLHQPLHNASIIDSKNTKGDRGGNLFLIDHKDVKDLHTLWDKGLLLYPEFKAPLSETDWKKLEEIAKDLTGKYTRADLKERLEKDGLTAYANESKAFAKEAYKGLTWGKALPKDYINDMKDDLEEQLTVAGYRLADTLLDLFKDESVLTPHRSKSSANDDEEGGEDGDSDDDKLAKPKNIRKKTTTEEKEPEDKKKKTAEPEPKKKAEAPEPPKDLKEKKKSNKIEVESLEDQEDDGWIPVKNKRKRLVKLSDQEDEIRV